MDRGGSAVVSSCKPNGLERGEGEEWHSRVVVQANGRGSRRMATVERIPVSAARKPKSWHETSRLKFDDVAPALQRQTTRLTRLEILERH